MLMKDLPRATVARPNGDIIYSDDGIQLKRISLNMIFPEATVTVTPEINQGTLIATMGINGNRVQLYAPESNPNAITGVRVNGRDVVRDHVADISIPVTDVKLNGSSVVRNRTAEINIPDLPEQFVEDVVDPNGVSLVDENHVAHVGGSGSGDVVDVVDRNNVSLLDVNKIAHIPGEADVIIQPMLDYERTTRVDSSTNWGTNQNDWTAPVDCVVFFHGASYLLYKYANDSGSNWINCVGNNVAPLGRCFIPIKKSETVTFQVKSGMSANYSYMYYIPFKKKPFFQQGLSQPYPDYTGIQTVMYTSNITTSNQIILDYTASTDGILFPNLFLSSRYEQWIKINDVDLTYNFCNPSELNLDVYDGIPISAGDNVKIYFGASSGTVTGSVKFIPFAKATNWTDLKSPIPDVTNMTKITGRSSLIGNYLDSAYYINAQYPDYSSTGTYPIVLDISGVTNTWNIDNRFYYQSSLTYDDFRPGRLYASGSEYVASSTPSANNGGLYKMPLVSATVEKVDSGGGGGGQTSSFTHTALFTGGTKQSPQGYLTLADDITKYDELEFWSVQTPYVSSQKFNVEYFISHFPHVASPNNNTTAHALVFPYGGSYCRVIMGRSNSELRVFNNASNAFIREIYGIKY